MRGLPLLLALVACDARRPVTTVAVRESAATPAREPVVSVVTTLATPPRSALAAPDLTRDIDARMAQARALGGAGIPVRALGGIFVLVGMDGSLLFDPSAKLAESALEVLLDGRLRVLPDQAVTVWLFSSPSRFRTFLKERVPDAVWETPHGLYHAVTREIFVNASPGITTLTHEMMHPLLQADFPRAPTWLVEGLASLYELPDLSVPGEIHGKQNFRHGDLVGALYASGPRPRLDSLFGLSTEAFRVPKDERLHYAMAREALRWLDSQGQLWPFYKAFRDGILKDATGASAFAFVHGKTPADANAEWIAWVESR